MVSFSAFRDFSLESLRGEGEENLMSVDQLKDLDSSIEEWPVVLVSQLSLRDEIINKLSTAIEELVAKAQKLEQDMDYLELKNLELMQEKEIKIENRKTGSSQTVEEDFAEAWRRWYSGSHYSVGDPDITDKGFKYSENCELGVGNGSESHECKKSSEEKIQISDCSKLRDKRKKSSKKKNKHENSSSTRVLDRQSEHDSKLNNPKKQKNPVECKEAVGSTFGHGEVEDKSVASEWDLSGAKSITEQVESAASHAMKGSGYVYDKKLGLYYDYSSGYYYNAENGLYYDGRTGTYFYYDHTSQSYQFHSQVSVEHASEEQQQSNKDDDGSLQNEREKPHKSKKEEHDAEEGECSDSEGDLEEVGFKEGDETDSDEEIGTSGGGYPTMRLMVVESESDVVRVGSLHLVTIAGGTVGRDGGNLIHFPDMSISKIHAEIRYNTKGPGDHHYYIKDLGSRSGTFVNGMRLSEPYETSPPYEVRHGWLIEFGWVQVRCHIHMEDQTCNECKIGLPPSLMASAPNPNVDVPPSLRLMVVKSESDEVRVGSLHLMTVAGGTIGSDTENLVQLSDENISTVHAEITYSSDGPDDHHYYVRDMGSTTGTYVNGSRLSEAQQPSQPVEVGHGSKLRFGGIKMECHLHRGHLTCNGCEPGVVLSNQPVERSISFTSKEKARKKEMKALRKKYGITTVNEKIVVSGQYIDRAEKRKKEVGSSNPYEKTEVASTETPLRDNNKGFGLLKKMGWSEGEGLGKSVKGIIEPVQPRAVTGTAGLGSSYDSAIAVPPMSKKQKKQWEQWNITNQRYEHAPLLDNNWTCKD